MYFSCTIDRGLYEVARPKIKRFSFFFCLWSCCLFLFFFFFFGLFDVCVKQCCPTINRNFILLSCPNKAASQLLLFVLVFICFSFLFLSSLLYLLFFSLLWTWAGKRERGAGCLWGRSGGSAVPLLLVGKAVSFHGCMPMESYTGVPSMASAWSCMFWLPWARGRDGLGWETWTRQCGGPGYGLLSNSPVSVAKFVGDCLACVAGIRNPSPKYFLAVSAGGDWPLVLGWGELRLCKCLPSLGACLSIAGNGAGGRVSRDWIQPELVLGACSSLHWSPSNFWGAKFKVWWWDPRETGSGLSVHSNQKGCNLA